MDEACPHFHGYYSASAFVQSPTDLKAHPAKDPSEHDRCIQKKKLHIFVACLTQVV